MKGGNDMRPWVGGCLIYQGHYKLLVWGKPMIGLGTLRAQMRGISMTLVLCLSYWLIVLVAGVAILSFQKDVSADYLLRDASVIMGAPPYVGMISNIGIMMWVAAGSIFLFVGYVLLNRHGLNHAAAFVLAFGLFALVLAVDDLFRLHERVFPRYLGIPENLVYATYAVMVATMLLSFRRLIFDTDHLLLAAALVFFGISLAVDMGAVEALPYRFVVENVTQFIGITLWLSYFVRTGAGLMNTVTLRVCALEPDKDQA